VRRVVCPVGYLEPSIRSNMEQASVFVLHLHSSGVQTGSLVPTRSRDIANFSITFPLVSFVTLSEAKPSHEIHVLIPSVP
jgi:hypothetical protein